MEVMEQGLQFLSYGLVFGFATGIFVVLAASALCAVVHTFKHVIS